MKPTHAYIEKQKNAAVITEDLVHRVLDKRLARRSVNDQKPLMEACSDEIEVLRQHYVHTTHRVSGVRRLLTTSSSQSPGTSQRVWMGLPSRMSPLPDLLVVSTAGAPASVVRPCGFFFQAEDGIRDDLVTGVQTCALPISAPARSACSAQGQRAAPENRGSRRRTDYEPCERSVPASMLARVPHSGHRLRRPCWRDRGAADIEHSVSSRACRGASGWDWKVVKMAARAMRICFIGDSFVSGAYDEE